MEVADAYTLISRAIDTGHAAHGYLVCGDLRGQCDALTEKILRKLFPNELAQVESRCHPDIAWLEPEGKSRTIHVKSMRERIVEPMSATAFSGGWKVGVIVGADRMETEAANSFLKTLEEPPPKTLFLLLTDQPDAMLPTIVSRSQRIDLPLSEGILDGDAFDAIEEVLSSRGVVGIFEKAQAGKRLAEVLSEVKDESEPEDVALARKAFYKTIMKFVRGWMVEGDLPRHQAFKNVAAVEDAFRQSERYLTDDAVLVNLADRLVWPA
jgi:DNA polymerase-3 subunit delta'